MAHNPVNVFRVAANAIGPCVKAVEAIDGSYRKRFNPTEGEQVERMLEICCDLFEALHAWMHWNYKLNDRAGLAFYLRLRLVGGQEAAPAHPLPCRAGTFSDAVEAMRTARDRLRAAGRGTQRPLGMRENREAIRMVYQVAKLLHALNPYRRFLETADEMAGVIGEGGVPTPLAKTPQVEW